MRRCVREEASARASRAAARAPTPRGSALPARKETDLLPLAQRLALSPAAEEELRLYPWPSVALALDFLAWDFFLGLALVLTAPATSCVWASV